MKLPNRFDIINAVLKEKNKPYEDAIGWIMDVRVDVREHSIKSKTINRNDGLPSYSPKIYTVKFLNRETKTFLENEILNLIGQKEWLISTPKELHPLCKPRYDIGDLIFNTKNQKISLIISMADFNGFIDKSTELHSLYWYKIQAPGQRWEPLSETFIANAIESGYIKVHKKKLT